MVLQWAAAPEGLGRFYGLVMEKTKVNSGSKRFDSKELFGGEKLILIEHEGTIYRLMITRKGKLILNK